MHEGLYMDNLKIAILGTRGIPNHYGGFEYAAERLSAGLAARGHQVTVYNSHRHPFKDNCWNGVEIVHCYDPERELGMIGQFIYDFNCIQHARKRKFDALLLMGYTSSSVWGRLYPRNCISITNMDGMEWKRKKYSRISRLFLKFAERLAVRYSDFYVADSMVIGNYLNEKYDIEARFIPYGADNMQVIWPVTEGLEPANKEHFLLMARMEPENNIELILDGFHASNSGRRFKVIGNTANRFGRHLLRKFERDERIEFTGPIFNTGRVSELMGKALVYFHGHSVGGTNPSLLQAMANMALIASHDNEFNRAVLQDDAMYFSNYRDVRGIVESTLLGAGEEKMIDNNLEKVNKQFKWSNIIGQYENFIQECYSKRKF